MTEPVVSCVMPTFNRRRFIPDAVENFRLQTYPNCELVIVDDGTDPVGDLVPDDPTIRYIRLQHRLSTGEKRNAACRTARGEIIVHWDDDDWSSPDRVEVEVSALLDTGADVCGLRDLLFYEPATDRGWRYRYPDRARPWVAGGTMCYHRRLWEAHPFPDVRQGEDTRFVWSSRSLRVHAMDRLDLYVATIHQANTTAKRTSGSRWSSVPTAEIRAILGDAAHRYRSRPVRQAGSRSTGTKERPVMPCATTTSHTTPATSDQPTREATHVTVSVPHHGASQHLRAAVESILAQTHRALTCVVVFDGDPAGLEVIADIDDPRLVRHVLAQNRGRYFADQVVLDATFNPYFLVQDSDDWSEPTRVERLLVELERTGADVCVSDVVHHDRRSGTIRTSRHGWPRLHDPVGPQLVHRAGHHGLYRTEIVRAIGGWYGGYRIGFDTSVLNLVMMVGGRVVSVAEPLYHRNVGTGLLNTSPTTGWNTPERRRVVRELRELHRRAYGATKVGTAQEAAVAIRRLVSAGRSLDAAAAMRGEAAALTAVLSSRSTAEGWA